jgi:hypothetical protein
MTLDLAAIAALEELEKAATCGAVQASEFRLGGWSPESSALIASLVNAAPELLRLAREALAARESRAAYEAFQASGGRDQALFDDTLRKIGAHRALVSAHQSGGKG